MEAIQVFLKEYDHIHPEEKCIALLLVEERFLKIKQTMEEEQNRPEVMQELLLKLMNDLQILKGIQQEKKEPAAQSFTRYWDFSMIDDEEARDNFMKYVCTFLRKFNRIPFGVTPKVILIAWESFGKIKDALMDKQYRQEDIQELMSKLFEDVRNISEELSEYINCPSWNRPTFYDNDDDEYTIIYSKPKAITPDLPIEEPDNSLNSSTFNALSDHYEILSDSNNDGTSSDDDDFEDIEYVSLEEVNNDQEEKEFDLEIESLNDNPTPDCVLKSPSPFPIPVEDSDSFFEKSDTSLSYSDNSLPEFETFSDHTEETRSGSTTTHTDNSLPEYDSFHFEIEPDQVSFPSGTKNKIFDPRISIEVQSERFLSLDEISNSFISDPLFLVIETLLPYLKTKPITVTQPHVITKQYVNSNINGLPSIGLKSTAEIKRPQPRSNPKNHRIPSVSKISCLSNNIEKVEEHHKNLQFFKTPNHMSSEGNDIKLAIRNEKCMKLFDAHL
ncbi:hypothetical protein Tco_1359604 [Tanacetum coccineum]